MKWSQFFEHEEKDVFVEGDWNVIDDITGFKVKASSTTKQWDGFRSQKSQIRHPQDFLRGLHERIRTPWARTKPDTPFINQSVGAINGRFTDATGWTTGSSWTIADGRASYLAGSTDTMFQSVNGVSGATYRIWYDVFNYVGAGGITASMGTTSGATITSHSHVQEDIVSAGANPDRLTFTPSAGGTSFDIDNVRARRI